MDDVRVASSPMGLHSASRSFLTPETVLTPHSVEHDPSSVRSTCVSAPASELDPSSPRWTSGRDRRWIEYGSWLNKAGDACEGSGVGARSSALI